MQFIQYMLERFSEPSTWRGVVALLTSTGIVLSPDQMEALIAVGLGVVGAIGTFFADKKMGDQS